MSNRGFASMTPERRAEISRLGGVAAHAKGNAHKFTSEAAREAGRLGGAKTSQDREHMSAIAKLGGQAKAAKSAHNDADTNLVEQD